MECSVVLYGELQKKEKCNIQHLNHYGLVEKILDSFTNTLLFNFS